MTAGDFPPPIIYEGVGKSSPSREVDNKFNSYDSVH